MKDEPNNRSREIQRLQQNLSPIRKIAGWNAETLGNKIGVTKQTISNLENRKTTMSFAQYIALRSVLDVEIASNNENDVLPKVVALLLDCDDELDDDNYSKVQEVAGTVAATAADGASPSRLNDVFALLLTSVPVVVPIMGADLTGSTGWALKLLK